MGLGVARITRGIAFSGCGVGTASAGMVRAGGSVGTETTFGVAAVSGTTGPGLGTATGTAASATAGPGRGSCIRTGSGSALVVGSTDVGTTVGSGLGSGACVAAACGVGAAALHATDAINANATTPRIADLPARQTSKSLASRPRTPVQPAWCGLTGPVRIPSLTYLMRLALAAAMSMARMSGSVPRWGG